MSTKAEQAWAVLNERQWLYLSVIYDADQAAEDDIKSRSARWEKTPPASQWRQITYDIKVPKDPRSSAGVTTPATPPRGLMARWSFAALTRLYAAAG
ncbi:MAG: hypothetical protein ACRDRW_01230 [Pseudonocardiaceae bacterium]